MSAVERGQIRTTGARTYVVLGDAGDGRVGSDGYSYREPHTLLVEVDGQWAGARFATPTRMVAKMDLDPSSRADG